MLHDFTEHSSHKVVNIYVLCCKFVELDEAEAEDDTLFHFRIHIHAVYESGEKNKQKNISIFTLNILSLYTTVRNTVQKEMLRYCFKLQP